MENTAIISVIVPVYNAREYLETCVSSIRNQTYTNIEIILVDDGSTDGSGELCDELGTHDSRIKVLHKANGGSTSARNAGLMESTGEYIGFVDGDDWIEPQMYERLLNSGLECGADVAVCRHFCDRGNTEYAESDGIAAGVYKKSDGVIAHNIIYSDDYKRRGISPNLWDKLFRRKLILKKQQQIDERTRYAEDDLCVYASLLEADVVVVLDALYYHYRQHPFSVCSSPDETYFEKITLFYQQMKSIFEEQAASSILLEKLKRYMLEFVIRGINHSFGFGYGNVVPFYQPPYRQLHDADARRIVLYGAGNVGRDYYSEFEKNHAAEVVLWVDMQYANYQKQGFPVCAVSELERMTAYDMILIALENKSTREKIRQTLIEEYHVDARKILPDGPSFLIEELSR